MQEELNATSEDLHTTADLNDQLAEQIDDLHSQLDGLEEQHEELQKLKRQKSAELLDSMQRATAEYDSLREQAQIEVDLLHSKFRKEFSRAQSLESQLQASRMQVQSLQHELDGALAQIQSLQSQMVGPQQDRLQVGQGLGAAMRSSSFGTPRRSPRSPTGSTSSSGSRGARAGDFQVSLHSYFGTSTMC